MSRQGSTDPGARLATLLEPAVSACDLVLETVTVTPAGKRRVVRVVVDLPAEQTGSLDLDKVAEVSRAISDVLDTAEPLGQNPYVLEVSSPGVDRPLTEQRHWMRARGRLVRTKVPGENGPVTVTGRITAADSDGVTLLVEEDERRVPWADLGTGRVQVEFSRPDDPDDGLADLDGDEDVDGADQDEREEEA